MKQHLRSIALVLSIASLSGCGMMQSYNNGLDAKQQAYARTQKVLDQQNEITLNNLKAQQRQQDIVAARAEGQKAQAQAAGDAQAAIEKAKGDAQSTIVAANAQAQAILVQADAQTKANRELAETMTPLLIQHEAIEKLSDKSIIYLPSNTLPYMNMATPGALPSNMRQ